MHYRCSHEHRLHMHATIYLTNFLLFSLGACCIKAPTRGPMRLLFRCTSSLPLYPQCCCPSESPLTSLVQDSPGHHVHQYSCNEPIHMYLLNFYMEVERQYLIIIIIVTGLESHTRPASRAHVVRLNVPWDVKHACRYNCLAKCP